MHQTNNQEEEEEEVLTKGVSKEWKGKEEKQKAANRR